MFSVSFPTQTAFTPQTVYCVGPASELNTPEKIKQCSQAKIWDDLGAKSFVSTNISFLVNVEAHLGGQKKGDPYWAGGRFYTPQPFTPDPNLNVTVRKTKFAFDLEPPYHCLSRSNNCTVFPIFVNQSMTNNPVVTPTFNEWHDDGSGLDRFHAEVYYMNLDSTGKLIPGNLIISQDVNITLNNFRFTCPTPGVYSIILTVYDKANNSARARKIINYDNHASSILETDAPIYLDRANPDTGYQFITNLEKPQNGASYLFNVIWTNHFVTSYKPEWLAQVAPWKNDASGSIIDDTYLTRYGLRSVDRVFVNTSILGLEIAYTLDNQTGGVGATPPLTFTALGDLTTDRYQLVIDPSLKDGDTIVVWIRVYDLYGKSYVFVSKTHVDTTRFNIKLTSGKFQKHYPDTYNSSVILTVTNQISGIKNITYEIYDGTKQLSVRTGTAFPDVLEPPNSIGSRKRRDTLQIPCQPSDPTCYCVPFRQCFNKTQLINIDNCWIDRVAGDAVTIRYTIYSLSGWGLSGTVDAGVLSADDIPCRSVLSTGAIIGISIASILAFIFLVALIILLILMCIRWRVYHKHPIPAKIRTTIHNTFGRNSTPTINIMSDNEIYASKESNTELPTVKKTNEKLLWTQKRWSVGPSVQQEDSFDDYLVSGKDIQINDVIDEGRFAVVRKGSLIKGNDKTPIAIKALKSGYDKKDPDVMRAKISFMANQVKPHTNIIRFIAAIDDGKDTGSPVMLLELCDKSLKDWLGELTQVDSEVLEEMLLFTLQIARGVQHLHDQKIIHRRLAVRNVLLKRGVGGYEAKLIGFGPSREDADDGRSPDESTLGLSVVPLKWMAPETLDTLNSNKPIYDEKTDAWSFAVTIWEIYSKGAAPYANHKSQDITAVLKRGERLTCPEYCPPEIFNQTLFPCWNNNPKKRPNFTKICSNIEQFRSGFGMGDGYYPTANAGGGRPNNAGSAGYYSANQAFANDHVPESTAGFYHDARSA